MTTEKGYEGNKKIQGRKRHVVTDTLGLIMAVVIQNANVQDSSGAKGVIEELRYKYPRWVKNFSRPRISWGFGRVGTSFFWLDIRNCF
ncbi:MAG TPA: transposase [Bacteroidales bacterium]|nr:transposase [Bacteroidales bacterium]